MNTRISPPPAVAEPAAITLIERARVRELRRMGEVIRAWRQRVAQETQEVFGRSLGVSRQTVKLMETGAEGVAIGTWMRAWQRMGCLRDVGEAVIPQSELDAAEASSIAADAERRHSLRTK